MTSTDTTTKSSATTDEIDTKSLLPVKSSAMVDDLELFLNLSFSHHMVILNGEKDVTKRWKYIKLALENKWDTRFLQQQIKEDVADHYGVMPSNFGATIKNSRDAIKALNMFKDEYLLDFINTEEIGIRDMQDIDECVVEKEIVHNIKKFIMTFGHDFAFVGNQYHLEVYSHDFFPDLLFFNRELNCLVVV
ncbi:MAG: PDDEXK nuclease domain-containing protein [Duncaniella sp.]|nr:PDDEXK nuclease domain-containing protein [Muribaculum sp.]MCM1254538.1 PDDEXK nuclease domain-containing protein [Duncaniella sp.]